MRAISLKISDTTLNEAGRLADELGLSRAAYIRRAIERQNAESATELRDRRLIEASRKVRDNSMRINAEFAAIESDPGD